MARIAGIQIEKDSKGRPAYARINLKKHKEAIPFLKEIGAIEETSFDIKCKEAMTIDEFRESIMPKIKKIFEK